MKKTLEAILPLFLLLVTVCMVTFSYAAFSVKMTINGDASIAKSDLNTDIFVDGIAFTNLTKASEDYNPGYNDIEAKMRITLNDNTSSASYDVTITNRTNKAYKISKHIIKKNSDNISVDKNALYLGRVIPANSSITISYTITNNSNNPVSDEVVIEYDFIENFSTTPKIEYDSLYDEDILTIGDEKFIVVSRDNGNIKALALNNLYVGGIYNAYGTKTNEISEYGVGYGIQNAEAKGSVGSGIPKVGTIRFKNDENLGSNMTNVYNSSSVLYSHVQDYVGYLRDYYGVSVTGSIPTIEDMNNLGCNISIQYGRIGTSNCNNASSLVTNSTYWTATSYSTKRIHVINPDKSVGIVSPVNELQAGIKPIITIPASSVSGYQALEYPDTYQKDGVDYSVSIIDIKGEKFYKLREDGDKVIAISEHNLDITNNKQYSNDSSSDNVSYSSSIYWGSEGNESFELDSTYGNSFPTYVFDSNSTISTHLTSYNNKLINYAPNVSVRLMNDDDISSFCNNNICDSNKPYYSSTSYWTGIAKTKDEIVSINSNNVSSTIYSDSNTLGIRPIIEINKSYIQARD